MFKKNKIKWKRLIFDSIKKAFIRIDWDSLPKNVEDEDEDEENEEKIEKEKNLKLKIDEKKSENLKKIEKFFELFKKKFDFLNKFSNYLTPNQFSLIVFIYIIFIVYLIIPKRNEIEKKKIE